MSSAICCDELSKRFKNNNALDRVSFEVKRGETVGLVGANGAGKTTLLRILCGFLHPSSGSVRIFDQQPGSKALLGKFSALPQDAQFDPVFSIQKQLSHYARLQGFSRKHADIEALRVLELMRLEKSANTKPNALSHGMRKRAAIAQALIGEPQLILLDEPTAGLDPPNARNIRQQITALSDTTTVLISSHNLPELDRLCQTILYMDKGHLASRTNDFSNLSTTAANRFQYLTLQIDHVSEVDVIATIERLPCVSCVSNKQKNEYVIHYDANEASKLNPPLDQQLLRLLSEKGLRYRQLINGKTLENRIFEL